MKALYYGDNLQVLRDSIATESVDLIYLDPPSTRTPRWVGPMSAVAGKADVPRMSRKSPLIATRSCSGVWAQNP